MPVADQGSCQLPGIIALCCDRSQVWSKVKYLPGQKYLGEIYDESDVEPVEMVVISDDEISIDGIAEVRIVEEFFGIDLPGKPTDTVSFWVLANVEYISREKEVFLIDDLEVEIIKASSRRIEGVAIRRPVNIE